MGVMERALATAPMRTDGSRLGVFILGERRGGGEVHDVQAIEDSAAHGDDDWEARVIAASHRLSKVSGLPIEERLATRHAPLRQEGEHDPLRDAALARDVKRAGDLLVRHIEVSTTYALRYTLQLAKGARCAPGEGRGILSRDFRSLWLQLRLRLRATLAGEFYEPTNLPSGRCIRP